MAKNTRQMSSRAIAVLVVVVLVLGATGTALATITASDATIHACAKRGTGELRLAQRCRANERAVSWNQQAPAGQPQGYAYVTGAKAMLPGSSKGVTTMTRSPDGDHYCFDLTFTPVNVVVSAGLNGSYIVADVVGPNTLPSDQVAAMCGTTAVDAVVYFPGGAGGFYATFN